jgi:hypothetical protein
MFLKLPVFLAIGPLVCMCQVDTGYRVFEDGNYEVTMHQVFCGNQGQRPQAGCRVHYSYRFERRTTVYITELGEAPATGEFEYVTKEPRVTFQASADGNVLAFIKVHETALTRGDPIPNFPAFRDFPVTPIISGRLKQNVIFPERMQYLLSNLFHSGYDPDEIRNGVRYFITGYRPIKSPHPNLSIEVAVMISNPEPAGDTKGFRIRWIGREKNKLDDDWHAPNPSTATAANILEFVHELHVSLEQ